MNRDQAKKLLPIIQAFADGKMIQASLKRSGNYPNWFDLENIDLSDYTFNYRIKPEKKTGWINIYDNSCGFDSRTGADMRNEMIEASTDMIRTACIQITYEEGEGL